MKENQKKAIIKALSLVFGSVFFLTGCLRTPDNEFVTNKEGLGNLVTNNVAEDEGIPLARQLNVPEQIIWNCDSVNAYTEVSIHANVTVPEVTTIPVYQVRRKELNSETLETYANALFDEGSIRNDDKVIGIEEAKSRVENLTRYLETGLDGNGDPISDYATRDMEGNPIDPMELLREDLNIAYADLQSLEEKAEKQEEAPADYSLKQDNTGIYIYDVYEYAGVTGLYDGKDCYLGIERDGINCALSFHISGDEKIAGEKAFLVKANKRFCPDGRAFWEEDAETTCSYSVEEAVGLCENFLACLGIEDMKAMSVEELGFSKDPLVMPWDGGDTYLGNRGYYIQFSRSYVEGLENYAPYDYFYMDNEYCRMHASIELGNQIQELKWEWEEKATAEQQQEGFQEPYLGEAAGFVVTDEGIVNAWVVNPMETDACLAENVRLLDFSKVEQQAKTQMTNLYADAGSANERKKIGVESVELNYAAMWAPDAEDEYILIPVWDFQWGDKTLVTINGIDGSLFEREKGY